MKKVLFSLAALFLMGCASTIDRAVVNAISAPKAELKAGSISMQMPNDPHMLMTRHQPAQPGDQARADSLAAAVERGVERFKDLKVAQAEGYQFFPPNPPQHLQIVHLVHRKYSEDEVDGFNANKPGSLLYERSGDGWRLVGAMITAPVDATPQQLDDRAPLSVTQWHLHQDICVPKPIWDEQAWARTGTDGKPLFGPEGAIASKAECKEANGRFMPVVFGWMTHAYVFAPNPSDLWNQHYGHGNGHGH